MFAMGIPEEEKEKGTVYLNDRKVFQLGERNRYLNPRGPKDPNRLNLNRATSRHIVIKLSKVKDRNNFTSSKRKEKLLITEPLQDYRLLYRNFSGQKRMG